MTFLLTDEQTDLEALLRQFMSERASLATTRQAMTSATGYDSPIWTQLAGELGLTCLGAPEEPGSQPRWAEMLMVLEWLGSQLYSGPYLASGVLAIQALLLSENLQAIEEHLPGLVSGERIGALAVADDKGRWEAGGVTATAVGDGWLLDGTLSFVVSGSAAHLLIVAAQGPTGQALYLVNAEAGGVICHDLAALDPTRRMSHIVLSSAHGVQLLEGKSAPAALQRLADIGAIALAAEQIGAARACLDLALTHARTRRQFGQPIGAFQAIQFKCADMFGLVVDGSTLVRHAAQVLADPAADTREAASLAKAYCSDAFTQVARETIQIHGGIGFTAEHDAHLYLRRARTSAALFGDADHHRERLAVLLEL